MNTFPTKGTSPKIVSYIELYILLRKYVSHKITFSIYKQWELKLIYIFLKIAFWK
jgi:hypothetical protein